MLMRKDNYTLSLSPPRSAASSPPTPAPPRASPFLGPRPAPRKVVGCRDCAESNHTEISFFGVFKGAVHRTLAEVNRRHGADKKVVAFTTFSPAHFEGDWDKASACPKKQPYKNGEKELGYTGSGVRFAALDVTKLANLRPDGHPGQYTRNAGGADARVQNDCVHWCMPGPIDTFNEILLRTIAR